MEGYRTCLAVDALNSSSTRGDEVPAIGYLIIIRWNITNLDRGLRRGDVISPITYRLIVRGDLCNRLLLMITS